MSVVSGQRAVDVSDPGDGESRRGPLFDLTGIDLSARPFTRAQIEKVNPHRGTMSLLDAVVWNSPDFTRGIALKRVGHDEFWVSGHFPGRPMFPGVLMIECGAQLACFMYNSRKEEPALAAFLRIEEASFRSSVSPGDDLFILCQDVKYGRRRFISDIQGLVQGRVAFEARITGMMLGERWPD